MLMLCLLCRAQVKTLPGEHVRPLQQDLTRISPDLVRVANQAVAQSNDLLGQLTAFASGSGLPQQVGGDVGRTERHGECLACRACACLPPTCLAGAPGW
jgi:hypothetical protein